MTAGMLEKKNKKFTTFHLSSRDCRSIINAMRVAALAATTPARCDCEKK